MVGRSVIVAVEAVAAVAARDPLVPGVTGVTPGNGVLPAAVQLAVVAVVVPGRHGGAPLLWWLVHVVGWVLDGPVATSAFSGESYAVRILAVNARGDADAVLELLGFELIDAHGIHRNASRLVCVDCPGATVGDLDILLARGGRVEVLVSFEVPDDEHSVEFRYAPLGYAPLESTNAARIWLR